MTYSYRTAKPSDENECVEIFLNWVDETPWIPTPEVTKLYLEEDWTAVFGNCKAWKTWVAENNTQIIGFCIRQIRDNNNIAGLYVAPEARGLGVGNDLLELAKGNCSHITVWAFEANEQARKIYRRERLVEVSREPDDVTNLMDIEHRWNRK